MNENWQKDWENFPNVFSIEEKTKTVYYGVISIDGQKFDARDLLDTIQELLHNGDIVITDKNMITMLKKYGILKSEGNSRWYTAAEKGPNIMAFLAFLEIYISQFEHYDRWINERYFGP